MASTRARSDRCSPTEPGREDTIVAVSTAMGLGAIGIVRMSGPEAFALAEAAVPPGAGVPGPTRRESSSLVWARGGPRLGRSRGRGSAGRDAVARTYTREDVVEVHCHGGLAAQRAVLRLMVRMGARLGRAGRVHSTGVRERAHRLAQAESVAAIVAARSTGALRASVRQLEGGLSERLRRCGDTWWACWP